MIWAIILLSLIGLCVLLGIANAILSKIKRKKHSEKGEENNNGHC